MDEAELNFWYVYRNKRMLPHRRFEYYMAQLTSQVSQLGRMWGGIGYPLKDFMFDEPPKKSRKKKDTSATGAEAIGAIVGGIKVIKLGQKRRNRG